MVSKELLKKNPDLFNRKHYIAKNSTQQPEFLKKHPNFDGRGVIIGIIDSCIDVSLPGLQKTSTGIPKIIDCIDLTGNGFVNTSTIKSMDKNNILIGLTGRKLRIPLTWKNPTGEWHLGIKSIYELFDEEALEKFIEFRENKIKKENEALKKSLEEISNVEERNFMLKYLKETENLAKDSIVLDCIVWNNGKEWNACLDTSFIGDLKNVKVLTNFKDSHEFGTFLNDLTFCLNIRENGNLLEICATYDEHGTVIANICAGFYPEEPEKNGLAPGAQIISFAVWDARDCEYGSHRAITRAFYKCIEMNVDIINFSVVSSFSSQGPMPKSGGCGVTLVAPGHGVAGMPRHYSYKTQLYDATSYSCPNAVGAISCLISGLKAKSIPITFFKLKLALINTAFLPKNGCKLSFGNGIIQIKNAFKFYVEKINFFPIQITNITTSLIEKNTFWKKLWENSDCKSGILLKVTDKNKKIYNYVVKININSNFSNENLFKIKWNLKLSKNAETFIKDYSTVNENNEFSIKIDKTELKQNSINYAEIIGFDSSNLFWGPLFYFPITVIIPKNFYETEKIDEIIELNSIFPYRLFIPPFSSEICGFFIRLKNLENGNSDVTVQIHCAEFHGIMNDIWVQNLDFDEKHILQKCKYDLSFNNDIHEICIILGDEKKINSFKFQFELSFIEKPSLFSQILSLFMPSEKEEDVEKRDDLSETNSIAEYSKENEIRYNFWAQKVKFTNFNEKKYFITTYYFTVIKKTWCEFHLKFYGIQLLTPFKHCKTQIFTLSKKFYAGYGEECPPKRVLLLPGKYIVKGLCEYFDDKIHSRLLPSHVRLPEIAITVNSNKVLKNFWTNSFDEAVEYTKWIIGYIGSYLPFSTNVEKHFNNIYENDSKLWLNILQKYYNNFESENVKKVTDLFLQKSKAKQFLQNYEKMENNAYFYEKELIKTRKSIILDILFYKTDAILNEYLKNNENIPIIFKTNFDFANFESKMKNESIFDILWSIFTYNFYPKSLQKPKNICPKLLNENVNFEQKNEIINIQPNLKSKNRKNVKNVTSLFLKFAEESDIRKTFILIKNALIFGNFGTALFYLNKISSENQTIPNYKIFDKIIIQILKQLGWKHLIEAHENALLDRHRNYFRMF
uniref:Peptidase S8/S53 domain-containing protein n=1 Tax=Panagrolaimus sp. PS1159 TaxID=55785 RepID=A0AC35GLR2_9BILA